MTRTLAFVMATIFPLMALSASPAQAQQQEPEPTQEQEQEDGLFRPVGDTRLDSFLWTARPIVVFADTPADPRFQEQIELLRRYEAELVDREVVVLTDTDPEARSPIRLKLRPRGFQMVLIDKDGGVKLRKPSPWSVREITRSIDKSALRLREVEERRGQ